MAKGERHMLNGETYYVRSGDMVRESCCDCSLTHLIAYRIVGKRIAITPYRDDYATLKARKRARRKP